MTSAKLEKGGGTFEGIKLLLCENPLPPLDEAIVAARDELARSNYYTEPYSEPLRQLVAEQLGVPERLIHINAGSELILRQIFDRRAWNSASCLDRRTRGRDARARCADPSHQYLFFLADFAPHDAAELAARLREREILVKPLGDRRLGPGYMRITTALPQDNARFVAALKEML